MCNLQQSSKVKRKKLLQAMANHNKPHRTTSLRNRQNLYLAQPSRTDKSKASHLVTAQHIRLHLDMARINRLNLTKAQRTQLQTVMARLYRSPLTMLSRTIKLQRTRLQDDKAQLVIGQQATTKRTQIPPHTQSTPILIATVKAPILQPTVVPPTSARAHHTEVPHTSQHHSGDQLKDRHKVLRLTGLLPTKGVLHTVRQHTEDHPKLRHKELRHTEVRLMHALLSRTALLKSNPAHTADRSDLPTLDTLARKQLGTTPLTHKATDLQIEARTGTTDRL